MSNYYISKCCGEQVEPCRDYGGRWDCQKCHKCCDVTAMIDKPGGVPEKQMEKDISRYNQAKEDGKLDELFPKLKKTKMTKTEQIREEFQKSHNWGDYTSLDKIADWWIKKLEEQKQEWYNKGRQSVFDELAEEQRKFTEGFAYKDSNAYNGGTDLK